MIKTITIKYNGPLDSDDYQVMLSNIESPERIVVNEQGRLVRYTRPIAATHQTIKEVAAAITQELIELTSI